MISSRTRKTVALLFTLALAGAVAGAALADVVVYKNGFSSRAQVKEIKKSGGKKCKRKFVHKGKKRTMMRAILAGGRGACTLRPPVQGDEALPGYTIQVAGKVTKGTRGALRRSAYLSVAGRVGGNGGYELRVFPKTGRFDLLRSPNGQEFPVRGRSGAIEGIGKKNKLKLSTVGAAVRATVNGSEVARVTDPDPGAAAGTGLRFAVGNARRSGKSTVATFHKLKVSVPDP